MEIRDFTNQSGRTISSKLKESYIKKFFPDEYEEILILSKNIGIEKRTLSEKVYHYINKLDHAIVCTNCKLNITKYRGLNSGYLEYCSSKCSNSDEKVMELKRSSYIEKYGVDNPSKSNDIIKKIQSTFDIKYGGNPAKNEIIKEKIRNTSLERYKDKHPFGKNSTLRKEYIHKMEVEFMEKYKDLNILLYNPEKNSTCIIKCPDCNGEYEISKWNLHQRYDRNNNLNNNICTICNPIGSSNVTAIESFIKDLLEKYDIEYISKDRKIIKPYEIDFFLQYRGIGIEANGIYWHSSKFKNKNYHINKTDSCLEKNISLIHIFEDDFILRKDIVESRILSILGIYKRRTYARKCTVREVDSRTANEFLDLNHLQGKCGSSVRLGLFIDDRMVSLMTFGKERRSLGSKHKEGNWELIRFCNENNHLVIGGASKLLSFFINNFNPIKITSFCDRRWSPSTDFYSKLGFNFIHNTSPNYWYYENNSYRKSHRFNFRKDVLVKNGADINKTELEIMEEMGYLRVYDCGSSKWEWTGS